MGIQLEERFYDFLTEEDEPRACEAIPEESCTDVPKNFTLNVANGTASKLAERIISPGITMAWIMHFFGASSGIIGALVPVKDAGSLLPQLFISGKIRSFPIRKYFWAVSALIQALCWGVASAFIIFSEGENIPIVLLLLLIIFSMASGVASVSYKDVIGKTIPKKVRGQMLSYRSTFGGILALLAGVLLIFFIKDQGNETIYAAMFAFASILWFLASFLFFWIEEEKGATDGGRNPVEEIKTGIKLIKKDNNFRLFLFTRACLMAVPLIEPFYVIIAKDINSTDWSLLGYLILANGIANVISSPIWGKIADKSATTLMRIAALISLAGIIYAFLFYSTDFGDLGFYAFIPVFLINGIAYSGARLSRKTYLVDYAPEDNRPTYVAIANTFIGFFTILAAGFGVIAQFFGLPAQLLFFSVLLVLVILFSFKLKSV